MTARTATPLYRHRVAARGYDLLNRVLWAPSGSDRLRRELVSALDLKPTDRVLEFGCGTGLVTRHLSHISATTTAIDFVKVMSTAAQRRAPSATIITGDVLTAPVDGPFDRIVLAFILHELNPKQRVDLLQRAAGLLAPDGRIGILEWALPTGPVARRTWATVVHIIEPTVAHDILCDGLDSALNDAELVIKTDNRRANGRARIITATPC